MAVVDCLGLLWWVLCNKLCFVCMRLGNGHENSIPPRGTGVGGVGCPWIAHLLCFGAVKIVLICMKWTINVHVFWNWNFLM